MNSSYSLIVRKYCRNITKQSGPLLLVDKFEFSIDNFNENIWQCKLKRCSGGWIEISRSVSTDISYVISIGSCKSK